MTPPNLPNPPANSPGNPSGQSATTPSQTPPVANSVQTNTPAVPPQDGRPTGVPPTYKPATPSPRPRRGFPGWAIALILVVVVPGLVTLVLWLVTKESSRDYDYSDGNNPEVEEVVSYSELEEVEDYSVPETSANSEIPRLQGRYQVSGKISKHPYTMDITISPDGNISGTYWNVLYDINLPVSGTLTPSGNMDITLGRGSETSHLFVERESEFFYEGTWGKKKHKVTARLTPGANESDNTYDSNARRFRVKGGGINTIARLGEYFQYENQGHKASNSLRAVTYDDLNYTLYTADDEEIAEIELIETAYGTSGVMTDVSGRRFELVQE